MTTPVQTHNHYYIGTEVVLQGSFTNNIDEPTDPTTVVCRVKLPDNSTVNVTASSTVDEGVFEAFFTITQEGKHWYRFQGTGLVIAAAEKPFHALEQHVPDPEV